MRIDRIVLWSIALLAVIATIMGALAVNSVQFVNPVSHKVTMYSANSTTLQYKIKNVGTSSLTDCKLTFGSIGPYVTMDPEGQRIGPGQIGTYTVTVEDPLPGAYKETLDVECDGANFTFDNDGYAPTLTLVVKKAATVCNIDVVKPAYQYVSLVGTPGAYSLDVPILVANTASMADNFTFVLSGVDCNISLNRSLVNGNSVVENTLSRCAFKDTEVSGRLVVSSSACDTAININLVNGKGAYYANLVRRYPLQTAGLLITIIAIIGVVIWLIIRMVG